MTANPFRGSCSPQPSIIPQKRKAIDPDGPQNPEEKFLASLDPSASPEAPAPMAASTSTQPERPVLTVSQQFLEAQTNLPALSHSIKKGKGKDWLTFVNLRNEHKWRHITLTGAALQAATVTLNKAITTLRTSHAIRKCLRELETDVMRRISARDYSSLYSSSVLFQALTIWHYTAIDRNTKEKRFSPWWKQTCDAVPGLAVCGLGPFHNQN